MANHESSTKETTGATTPVELPPIHKDFTWLRAGAELNEHARFAASVKDISAGAKVIAEVTRVHLLNLEAISTGVPTNTLMSVGDIDSLMGLAAASLDALCQLAEQKVEFFNNSANQGARA
jgi:hypothetical protein